jgi:WD40 repeat protein
MVTAAQDGVVSVRRAGTGVLLSRFQAGSAVERCAISPDGAWLLSCGGRDRSARLWRLPDGAPGIEVSGHEDWVSGCAFAPDGRRILTSSADGTARLWETDSGRQVLVLKGHDAWLSGCAFSPTGTRVVTCGGDGQIRVWDAFTGRCEQVLVCAGGVPLACAISPDAGRVAAVTDDRTLRVWDIERGECTAAVRVGGSLTDCAWSVDGTAIFAVGDLGAYQFAFIEPGTAMKENS